VDGHLGNMIISQPVLAAIEVSMPPGDLVSIVVSVLAFAHASAIRGALGTAAKDALKQVNAFIKLRYKNANLNELTSHPHSERIRVRIESHLRAAGANEDVDLLAMTRTLAERMSDDGELSAGIQLRWLSRGKVIGRNTSEIITDGDIGAVAPAAQADNLRASEITSIARGSGTNQAGKQIRRIDANLMAEHFAPGAIATLTIVIRLPCSPIRGKWQAEAILEVKSGPIQVILEARGFTIVSEPPPQMLMPEDRDSAPFAFELRIEENSPRWLHILLTQDGLPVGELTINDFSLLACGPIQHMASSPFRRVAEADLMLVIRAGEGRIEVCSPRDRASLDHVTMTGFKYPETSFRDLLASRLRALYDSTSDPEATARELGLVGVELAGHLPQDLIKLLRRPDVRSVMLRHEDDFDFPLELVYLDDREDPFFVGDRIAVCRWYLGVTNLPDVVTKHVQRVAFLKGTDKAFAADEALLSTCFKGRMETFERRSDVIDKLFKTATRSPSATSRMNRCRAYAVWFSRPLRSQWLGSGQPGR
jgi:hypothetical protein